MSRTIYIRIFKFIACMLRCRSCVKIIEFVRVQKFQKQHLELVEKVYDNTFGDHALRDYVALHISWSLRNTELRLADLNELGEEVKVDFLTHVCEQDSYIRNECSGEWPSEIQLEDYFAKKDVGKRRKLRI